MKHGIIEVLESYSLGLQHQKAACRHFARAAAARTALSLSDVPPEVAATAAIEASILAQEFRETLPWSMSGLAESMEAIARRYGVMAEASPTDDTAGAVAQVLLCHVQDVAAAAADAAAQTLRVHNAVTAGGGHAVRDTLRRVGMEVQAAIYSLERIGTFVVATIKEEENAKQR